VPQDSLKDYLAKADVYVFPSLAEGGASSGVETMAADLPVIPTWESGLAITHGESGWIVPEKSVEKLVNAIHALAADRHFDSSWVWPPLMELPMNVPGKVTQEACMRCMHGSQNCGARSVRMRYRAAQAARHAMPKNARRTLDAGSWEAG
jgi:glycosyltransferase involved in cell wall biosynthesis